MSVVTTEQHPMADAVMDAAERACDRIPPAWPLEATVAVNPYLGQAEEGLAEAGARLGRLTGAAVTMPRSWYAARIDTGEISDADIAAAIETSRAGRFGLSGIKADVRREAPQATPLPTVALLAAMASATDWPGIIDERFGHWAGGYHDAGQALWGAPRRMGPWRAWRAFACHDLTPEILGLKGFATAAQDAPDTAVACILEAVDRLGVPQRALQGYFHQLLLSMGGWAQLARQPGWAAAPSRDADTTLLEYLAVRLFWEMILHDRFAGAIAGDWKAVCAAHAQPLRPSADQIIDAVLQEAMERSAQRRLAVRLAMDSAGRCIDRPAMQAAFCIDVRSEIFRRVLESVNPAIETLGFAGFFGLAVSHRSFASDVLESRLPVLLQPVLTTTGSDADEPLPDERAARIRARARRAWGRFKLAAVSSFTFVESAGPIYLGKLLRDGFGLGRPPGPEKNPPRFSPTLPLDERVGIAERILRAMSLTDGFAPLVIIAGHGAGVVNNPHASALQCGACGGYSGEVNARLLAAVLNEDAVRDGLRDRGLRVPADTVFVAALHDTSTDEVTLFDSDQPHDGHDEALAQARGWLASAGRLCRGERGHRLPGAPDERGVAKRGRDWAQVRPEWGLAGCAAFVAAPREHTAGRDLGGRTFLHSYDWRQDEDFQVLELIMTAPVVVASWISLQYYGSTVAPALFGAGNKLLHNVVGGIGVVEGNGGQLRVGLPWQSVHDGERFIHEPLRLSVCIQAPTEAMSDILARHASVRTLFDNRWLHLFALDDAGRMVQRYLPSGDWAPVDDGPTHVPADEPVDGAPRRQKRMSVVS